MTKLTKLLNEKVTGVQWLKDSMVQAMNFRFPLTNSIAKELGLGRRIEAVHFTSPRKAMKLISMQGTKKSISAMTKVPKETLLSIDGIWERGVIYKVQGNLLATGMEDIGSSPDQRGRRWVDLEAIHTKKYFSKEEAEQLRKTYENFLLKNEKYAKLKNQYDKETKGALTNTNILFINSNQSKERKLNSNLSNMAKQFLSLHFDLSLQFVKQYKDLFEGALYFPSDKIAVTSGATWNEVILNDIKLLSVVYNINAYDITKKGGKALEQKIINSVPPGKALGVERGDKAILKWVEE